MESEKVTGPDLKRRTIVAAMLVGAVAAATRTRSAELPPIEVWTGPNCSCCHGWVDYLKANGFEVTSHNGGNSDARERLGMPVQYGSCHTGAVAGYALEGHVPVREINRLIAERPDAIGLSVPSMPRGSPGMDGPVYGNVRDPYDVLLVKRDGSTEVYQSYR